MKLTADTTLYGLPGTRYEGITAKVESTMIRYVHLGYDRPALYPSGITVLGEPMAIATLEMYFSAEPQDGLFTINNIPDRFAD